MSAPAYDYASKTINPQFGVTASNSPDFGDASAHVYAWFAYLSDAQSFVGFKNSLSHIWDLNEGKKVQ